MKILLLIGILLLLTLVFDGVRMYLQIKKSSELIEDAIPFSRAVENPSIRILVLGDSTAYGTGAKQSEDTTAGRLGSLYPDASIENRAVNGQKIEGLLKILETIADTEDAYDLILIQIGANDIIRLTNKSDIESGISTILEKTSRIAKQVIVLHSGDVGQATFFPWYVRPIHTNWSYAVRDIYREKEVV
jgi:lysophospholipase L1-like esterase